MKKAELAGIMFFKKSKTGWRYVFIISSLAILGGATLTLRHNRSLEYVSSRASSVLATLVPMPTEINANFLAQVNECFIPVAAVYGYTLRVTSGFRTTDEQAELYEQGRTVDGHIVSWAPEEKSIHNYGFAADVVDRWRGYNINWKKLAKIGQYCGLEQVDDPHFEHRGGLSTEQFVAGERPSPLELPCAIMGERTRAGQALTRKDLQDCSAPTF